MKLANAIEGGITGATTLSLLQEALHKLDHDAPRPLFHKSGIIKELKKHKEKPGNKSGKLYVKLASELLTNVASFGLIGLGKKKNVILRGGLLGAAAGLGSAFLQDDREDQEVNGYTNNSLENNAQVNALEVDNHTKKDGTKQKLLTVALYTAGGLLAGVAIKQINKSNKKTKKKNKLSKWVKNKMK